MNSNLHIVKEEQFENASTLERAILRALIYFDIFQYPLSKQEIILFCNIVPENLKSVERVLDRLCNRLLIFKFDDLYSIHNSIGLADRRRCGNKGAIEAMPKAIKRAKLIQAFPFVRSVNISGSMSKNYFDADTDVDFFVITSKNRIWLTRLMLTFYKKVFLLNQRKYFCVNYFIDTQQFLIPDKNLFAATEIVTLKNVTGDKYYHQFLQENAWVSAYFPNFEIPILIAQNSRMPVFKRSMEKLLSGKFGDRIDDICFSLMQFFLRRKYRYLNETQFEVNMRGNKHASKHHPQGFQFKVLEAFNKGCHQFSQKHDFPLDA